MQMSVDRSGDRQLTWSIEDSEKLYHLSEWGTPYFSINAAGHVTVSPQGDRGGSLDLYELVEALRQRNINLPLVIRFCDILADRLERLHACFDRAISRYRYPGSYRGVYPIKCNQHRHLVEALVKYGKPYRLGLEVGSKPELIIGLASLKPGRGERIAPLICNGYKDRAYIETALLATRLGHTPILVIEQFDELELVIQTSRELEIEPILGVRAKLSTRGSGHWGTSSGDRAKFGLTVPEILAVVEGLVQARMLPSLQLLHFHIGSQVSDISIFKDAIREAAQVYVSLVQLGANMHYLDVGGGLAVDYDGSKTQRSASKNYNMQNYANDVVAGIKEACEAKGVAVPTIVSESGRAIASHQSVLIFNVLSCSTPPQTPPATIEESESLTLRNLWEAYEAIDEVNYQEAYHDAIQFKEEAASLFNFGYLSLAERGRAEQLYWECCRKILAIVRQHELTGEEWRQLEKNLALTYHINLSIFRSLPDAWAISQLFPIMPIHRLDEVPTERGVLADITCDSDGKLAHFINPKTGEEKEILELHSLEPGANYYLGAFLVGSYQEMMGNLHNLFGDTNVVYIRMEPQGYQVEHVARGDAIASVLEQAQYDVEELVESVRRLSERALQEKRMTLAQSRLLLQHYEGSLRSYTYLER